MEAPLSIWVVYNHPKDYPDVFIARRQEVGAGVAVATNDTIIDRDLTKVRLQLQRLGLFCLSRHHTDDPVVVETWL